MAEKLTSAQVLKMLQQRAPGAMVALDMALMMGDTRVAMYIIDRVAPPEKLMNQEAARVIDEQRALIERLQERLERLTEKHVVSG
jgi:uncharacterized coiled-coil protein SlyX